MGLEVTTKIGCQCMCEYCPQTLLVQRYLDKDLKLKAGGNSESAEKVGTSIAEKIIAKGIKKVTFDRSGYKYHGRVKALADAARSAGLEF